jgi:acyl-coenzyme A thioesterase PaaI-like protein
MPFAGNSNHIGTMYAGALFTLAEIPGGAPFLTSFDVRRFHPIVKALNLKFPKPAKADVRVEAEASEKGKAEFTLNLEPCDEACNTAAVSEGICQLRRNG